jgi:serine protease Do
MKLIKIVREKPLLIVLFAALVAAVAMLPIALSADKSAETAATLQKLEQLGEAFSAVAEQITPVVVSIRSEKAVGARALPRFEDPFGDAPFDEWFKDWPFRIPDLRDRFGARIPRRDNEPRYRERGLGSGIIIDAEGYILTNNHVVRDADKLTVVLSGNGRKEYDAKVVGTDPKSDLAVIKIDAKNLPVAKLGDSDAAKVGQWVVAIGAPFGLTHTVTAGIVSAKGRANVGVADYEDLIQTDAAINPGNSGGPLVNLRGEVVGVNTAISSRSGGFEGIGFAIPVNMAKKLLPTLKSGGKIARGYLGVMIQNATAELAERLGNKAEARGALVAELTPDAPASKAGIEAGDIIIKYNGKPVEDSNQLRIAISSSPPGTRMLLTVLRKGEEKDINVELGELPSEPPLAAFGQELPELGIAVQNLTPELARNLGAREDRGVVIASVEQGSSAHMAGLREGDVIVEVNRKRVASVEDFKAALAISPKSVLMRVKNADGTKFVVIRHG